MQYGSACLANTQGLEFAQKDTYKCSDLGTGQCKKHQSHGHAQAHGSQGKPIWDGRNVKQGCVPWKVGSPTGWQSSLVQLGLLLRDLATSDQMAEQVRLCMYVQRAPHPRTMITKTEGLQCSVCTQAPGRDAPQAAHGVMAESRTLFVLESPRHVLSRTPDGESTRPTFKLQIKKEVRRLLYHLLTGKIRGSSTRHLLEG